jgi:uncharacterized RDD family membrane protein YckC
MKYMYGGFWRRFYAFMIDEMLLTMIGWVLFLIGGSAMNLGLALDDMAVAPEVYRRARALGLGTWLQP